MSSGGVVAAMRGSDDEDLGATDWELADMMARARIDVPLQEVRGRTSRNRLQRVATGHDHPARGSTQAGAAQYNAVAAQR
jgi:hypothetical protein